MSERKDKNKLYAISCMPLPYPKQKEYTYTELYAEYWENVYRGLYRNTQDKHHAEDLAQETFLHLLKYFDRIEFRTIHSLLAVISSQFYFKWKRAVDNAPNFREDDDDPFTLLNDTFEETCNGLLDPLQLLQKDEFLQERFARIEELTEVDQDIIYKVFVNGMPMRDVAEELDLTYGSVRKRLQRMRNKIGNLYGERHDS